MMMMSLRGGGGGGGSGWLAFSVRLHPPQSRAVPDEPSRDPLKEVPREAPAPAPHRSGSRDLVIVLVRGSRDATVGSDDSNIILFDHDLSCPGQRMP